QLEIFFDRVTAMPFTNLLVTILTFIIGWIAIKYIVRLTAKFFGRHNVLDPSVERLLTTVLKWGCYFVLCTMCADRLGVPMTSLVALVGTAGLALSLALQDSLRNLAGGIFIITAKPFKTGDYIEAGATGGTVMRIDFFHTVLQTIDNRLIYIPNGALSGDRIINYSAQPTRRLDITFPVAYSCNTKAAQDIISAQIAKDERVLSDPAPVVRMWTLSSSSV
ncbi:MAG: mechanosensitive ion channel, partial [Angelakisella sp.]